MGRKDSNKQKPDLIDSLRPINNLSIIKLWLLMGGKESNKQKPDLGNLRPKLSDARS